MFSLSYWMYYLLGDVTRQLQCITIDVSMFAHSASRLYEKQLEIIKSGHTAPNEYIVIENAFQKRGD